MIIIIELKFLVMESTVNERITNLTKELGFRSVREFASKIGISQPALQGIVKGSEPKYGTLLKILKGFPRISTDWLMLGEGSMFRKEIADNEIINNGINNNLNKKSMETKEVVLVGEKRDRRNLFYDTINKSRYYMADSKYNVEEIKGRIRDIVKERKKSNKKINELLKNENKFLYPDDIMEVAKFYSDISLDWLLFGLSPKSRRFTTVESSYMGQDVCDRIASLAGWDGRGLISDCQYKLETDTGISSENSEYYVLFESNFKCPLEGFFAIAMSYGKSLDWILLGREEIPSNKFIVQLEEKLSGLKDENKDLKEDKRMLKDHLEGFKKYSGLSAEEIKAFENFIQNKSNYTERISIPSATRKQFSIENK
jgi:transcriptional regulator with XRE-family HTH domain